jgi:hypothetical protein
MELNHRPPVCEPVPQDKVEYTKIEEKLNILARYELFSFSCFMLF